jgi:hypothetical protein
MLRKLLRKIGLWGRVPEFTLEVFGLGLKE